MAFNHDHILDMKQFSAEDITTILDTADSFKEISQREIKKVPALRGKTVVNLFFEASTRTRTSFEVAAKRLSADGLNIAASTSAVVKGETLEDTAQNILAMKPNIIVMRHGHSGAPHYLAERLEGVSILNAGDGCHEHPSQALLDMMTIREKLGGFEGLKVTIIGDIAHSRVARSNLIGLKTMGAEVRLAGPGTMVPREFEQLGAKVHHKIEDAIDGSDVVMMLRIQRERQGKTLIPSTREFARYYGLNPVKLKLAKPNALVMHPGPMNRGVEISSSVADGEQNVILEQVENGVAVRMALLYLVSGADGSIDG